MATVGAGIDNSIGWLNKALGSGDNWRRVSDAARDIMSLPGRAIQLVPNEIAQSALSRAYEMGVAGATAGLGAGAWNMLTPGQSLDVDPGTVGLIGALGTGAVRTGLVRPEMEGSVFRGLKVPTSFGVDTAGLSLGSSRPWDGVPMAASQSVAAPATSSSASRTFNSLADLSGMSDAEFASLNLSRDDMLSLIKNTPRAKDEGVGGLVARLNSMTPEELATQPEILRNAIGALRDWGIL